MSKKYVKISELNDEQKEHLAWRLDHRTYVGMFSASAIARGNHGDMNLVEVFEKADMTNHQAKIHATKVMNFKLTSVQKMQREFLRQMNPFRKVL